MIKDQRSKSQFKKAGITMLEIREIPEIHGNPKDSGQAALCFCCARVHPALTPMAMAMK
jgi:hypothetical protein